MRHGLVLGPSESVRNRGDRATPDYRGYLPRANPWLQLQRDDISLHVHYASIADRIPQRNEMPIASFCDAKKPRLDVVKPLRSFPSSRYDEGGSYDARKLSVPVATWPRQPSRNHPCIGRCRGMGCRVFFANRSATSHRSGFGTGRWPAPPAREALYRNPGSIRGYGRRTNYQWPRGQSTAAARSTFRC